MHTRRRFLVALGSTALTSALWIPSLSTLFGPSGSLLAGAPDDPLIRGLLARQQAVWGHRREDVEGMRFVNPEWDLITRAYFGLAVVQLGADRRFADALLEETLDIVDGRGMRFFMMGYSRGRFQNPSGSSLFVDSQLALWVTRREHLVGDGRFSEAQAQLVDRLRTNMLAGPIGHGESYPNECWSGCNAYAAVALQLDEALTGRSHQDVLDGYRAGLRALQDPDNGMVASSYTYDRATPLDGPEGSTLMMTVAMAREVDPAWAAEQYALGRTHFLRDLLGFGYAREWPVGRPGAEDVDSGPLVPGLEASAGASGMAVIAALAMGDQRTSRALLASMWAAAFPTWNGDELSFAASNLVGDAALLFALSQGGAR